MSNENNNTSIILGSGMILGFLLVIFLIFNRQTVQPQVIQEPQLGQPQPMQEPVFNQPFVNQPYPHTYPEYHNDRVFWEGYSDGWNGFNRRSEGTTYLRGYEIGNHDRRCNHPYYHERYYPPGFSLRLPGLHINVR